MFQWNSINLDIILYADDTAIIFHGDTAVDLQIIVNDFFVKYTAWCIDNCIVINPAKSKYLTFNVTDVVVNVNGVELADVHCAKYLGVFIDNKLCWIDHVDYAHKMLSENKYV